MNIFGTDHLNLTYRPRVERSFASSSTPKQMVLPVMSRYSHTMRVRTARWYSLAVSAAL